MLSAIERVIATARAEVGYLEKASNSNLDSKTGNAGSNNFTKYARDLDSLGIYNGKKNGYAWCDVFVDWCFINTFGTALGLSMTYQPKGGYGAGCTESARYYKNGGRLVYSNPQPGDQIFFTNDGGKTYYHTGLVVAVKNGYVYTIEGNTSSASGVVPNGGGVHEKSYSLSYSKIGAYGRPNYAAVPNQPDLEEEEIVTEAQFEQMYLAMRKKLQDNDASEWSAADRQWAIDNGIINGSGKTETGEPNYMWQDTVTREQMAALLHRVSDYIVSEVVKQLKSGS